VCHANPDPKTLMCTIVKKDPSQSMHTFVVDKHHHRLSTADQEQPAKCARWKGGSEEGETGESVLSSPHTQINIPYLFIYINK
jgi:hypothetical protein